LAEWTIGDERQLKLGVDDHSEVDGRNEETRSYAGKGSYY
jgi:hypothetical protein